MEPVFSQLPSLVSLFPLLHGTGIGISPAGWRVLVLVFLIMERFPRERLDSEALRYVALLAMAENRGECSLIRETLSASDRQLVEAGETVETRERQVRGRFGFGES